MNDAIRISRPADILGFIPHALGFAPRESFVFLTLRENTLGATLRVDAPLFGDPVGFARSMVGYLAVDNQATAVLLAIYTNGSPAATQRPFHNHVEAVIQELEIAGTPLKDAWLVTPERWQNLLCDSDAGCCQPEPLESTSWRHPRPGRAGTVPADHATAGPLRRGHLLGKIPAGPLTSAATTLHCVLTAHCGRMIEARNNTDEAERQSQAATKNAEWCSEEAAIGRHGACCHIDRLPRERGLARSDLNLPEDPSLHYVLAALPRITLPLIAGLTLDGLAP
jgi:hypothetical protein